MLDFLEASFIWFVSIVPLILILYIFRVKFGVRITSFLVGLIFTINNFVPTPDDGGPPISPNPEPIIIAKDS